MSVCLPGTDLGTFWTMIGSRKTVPPRMLRIVPLGDCTQMKTGPVSERLDVRVVVWLRSASSAGACHETPATTTGVARA